MISILFSENENCDAKTMTLTKRESYHNHDVCQNNFNMIKKKKNTNNLAFRLLMSLLF